MSNLKSYFKNDFYLIVFYIITVILAIQWQDYTPYISRQREMSILEDFFICALFAFSSAIITWVGLSRLKTENKETIYLIKYFLGFIYGFFCTIIIVYIADTSTLRHEFTFRITITAILFYVSVYFSSLYYAKLDTGKIFTDCFFSQSTIHIFIN